MAALRLLSGMCISLQQKEMTYEVAFGNGGVPQHQFRIQVDYLGPQEDHASDEHLMKI